MHSHNQSSLAIVTKMGIGQPARKENGDQLRLDEELNQNRSGDGAHRLESAS